jgi:hypothetical protein
VFRELVPDPLVNDARRTFTITVPAGSPARNAVAMEWAGATDATTRPMLRLADVGTDQVWRAVPLNPGGTAHLRAPNQTFDTVRLYYQPTEGSQLSLPSTYSFTETVPDVGDPDPVLTQIVNLDTLRMALTTEGYAYQIVTKSRGVIWQMP